jgi:gliding motility-associated-like protein/uncharacterized repeat protein (TIGR01451 family)
MVTTEPFTSTAITDNSGRFTLYPDSGDYKVKTIFPRFYAPLIIKDICPPGGSRDISITDKIIDGSGNNFAIKVNQVPVLKIDFTQTGMRPCTEHPGLITYSNIGTKDTFNVRVFLVLPPNTKLVRSSDSFTRVGDTLFFKIDTLKAGMSSSIVVTTFIDCIGSIGGQYRCFKVGISPSNYRYINLTPNPDYDSSSIVTYAYCPGNGYYKFSISNKGKDMGETGEYRLYENSLLCFKDTFKLKAGGQKEFSIRPMVSTYRLEADQSSYYPASSNPNTVISGCWSYNFKDTLGFNGLPDYYEGFTYKEKCYLIVNSYDPNAIEVKPEGVGVNKVVKRKEPLHYKIQFQNTGTDTAYDVYLIDTLSGFLDYSTLELDGASHKFTTEISGNDSVKVLKFIFRGIYLVDSNHDEKNSHGFISYTIFPFNNVPSGSRINSKAFIYFDINDPVETNTAFVSIVDMLPRSSNYPIQTFARPVVVLDTIGDLCASQPPIDLNIRASLNTQYVNDSSGQWFVNGKPIGGSLFDPSTIVFNPGVTGPVDVEAVFVLNLNGFTVTDSTRFKVFPVPVITLHIPQFRYSACDAVPQSFSLSGVSSLNPLRDLHYFIDGIDLKNNQNFIPSDLAVGIHKVRCVYLMESGCFGALIDSFYIEPKPHVSVKPIKDLCEAIVFNPDSGFTLDATVNAPYKGHWINYGGTFIRGTKDTDSKAYYLPGIQERDAGVIHLEWESLSLGLTNECKVEKVIATARIVPTPEFHIVSDEPRGCYPHAASFSIVVQKGSPNLTELSYQWNFGDPASGTYNSSVLSKPAHTFINPGTYTITCKVMNRMKSCLIENLYTFQVNVFEKASPRIILSPDSPGYTTQSKPAFKLNGINGNNNATVHVWNWWWDEPVDYDQPGTITQNAEHVYLGDSGSHTITLRTITVDGCISEVKRTVHIYPDITIFIPNVFSPDDDGPALNERFRAEAQGVKAFEITIYNRLGGVVYTSNNYTTHGWDGNFKNQPLTSDVFVYKVNVITFDERKLEYSGTLQLIR